jgi:transposase
VEQWSEVFVEIDVAKLRNVIAIAIAVADGERGGEVHYLGEIDVTPGSMRRLVKRLAAKHARLHFCYESPSENSGLIGRGVGRGS